MKRKSFGRFMSIGGRYTVQEKAQADKRRLRQLARIAAVGVCLFLAMPVITGLLALHKITHSDLPDSVSAADKPTYVFFDESGDEIGTRGPYRRPVDLANVPQHTVHAFLAIEDRRFYSHEGIDFIGITRAAIANYKAGEIVEGGSTITQQLVKNLYLTSEKTFDRKLQEAIYALRLENKSDKQSILRNYLYTIYFGSNAYGIEAAADVYFGKSAADLSIAESAMLAGLIKAPSSYNPFQQEQLARDRARITLQAMRQQKYITPVEEQLALYDLENLSFKKKPASPNSYFLDLAANQVEETGHNLSTEVQTTLNRPFQLIAENAVKSVMTPAVREKFNAHEAALVAMRPTGEVIAVVGGLDYSKSQFNRAAAAKRQPGSLFKAFVYDAALKKGWRPDDYVVDVPITLHVPDKKNEYYKPANYNNRYAGLMTTEKAFAKSANTAALRLQEWTGREAVIRTAHDAGLDVDLDPWPSLALGVFETNLLDITAAYASLIANDRIDPVLIDNGPHRTATSPSRINRELLTLMRASVTSGTSHSTQVEGLVSFGKTGTTQDYRDAWYVGLTDELIVGVWVGNDDYKPMNDVTGASLPGAIWKHFMEEALPHLALEKNSPTFSTRPLAEIVSDEGTDNQDTTLASFGKTRQRILGKAKINADGSLNFYGRNYRLAGIDSSYFQPYTMLAHELPSIANYREMMCEIHGSAAKCEMGGSDLSSLVAARGWAPISPDAESELWYAERTARDSGKGIWANTYQYAAYSNDTTAAYTETHEAQVISDSDAIALPSKYELTSIIGEAGGSLGDTAPSGALTGVSALPATGSTDLN